MSRPKVLVIGAGVGGLCLVQGLRQAGVEVAGYERDDAVDAPLQNYRLRIVPDGVDALRACLPVAVLDQLTATAMRYDDGLAVFDENLVSQWAPEIEDKGGDARRIDAVDRLTLRRVLLCGVADAVSFGKTFTHYEQLADGRVKACFADGSSDTGDVLVAADGADSRVRAQQCPTSTPRDLGVRAIVSRVPRSQAIAAGLNEILRDRFTSVVSSDGVSFGFLPMVFRTRPEGADDYYMVVFNVHQDDLGLADSVFFSMSGPQLLDYVHQRTSAWHPDLKLIFANAQAKETYPIALRAHIPVRAWPAGNVVPLGDAVHTMPLSGGLGANTAAQDAGTLTNLLGAVARGERLLADALARYQADVATNSADAVLLSLRIAKGSMKKLYWEEDET